jgi:hypothetical protein
VLGGGFEEEGERIWDRVEMSWDMEAERDRVMGEMFS